MLLCGDVGQACIDAYQEVVNDPECASLATYTSVEACTESCQALVDDILTSCDGLVGVYMH